MGPESKCPLWEKFLNEVLPEKEKQETLRSFIKAIPTRSCEQMLVLFGSGSNGKSVVMGVIANFFKYDLSTYGINYLMGKRSEYCLSVMDGKKINICSGLDGIKEAKFKQIIDGEKMPCRQPYGEPYLTTSLPMFVCETNNIPSKLSDGILRRLSIINFEVEVKNHDYSLGQKLSKESDGIKEWAGIK